MARPSKAMSTAAAALVLAVLSSSAAEAARFGGDDKAQSCPLTSSMRNFDLNKFTGDWYVLEYEYPKKMDLHALSCIGLHFAPAGFGGDSVLTNFTFRFPSKTGNFYHVPTISLVTEQEKSVWETQFRGVDLISLVLDTDYESWAVLVQCHEQGSEPLLLSTRVLSRSRSLGAGEWMRVESVVERAMAAAEYRYPIDQTDCAEVD